MNKLKKSYLKSLCCQVMSLTSSEKTIKKFLQESLFWNREKAGKFTEQHCRPFPFTVPEYTPF